MCDLKYGLNRLGETAKNRKRFFNMGVLESINAFAEIFDILSFAAFDRCERNMWLVLNKFIDQCRLANPTSTINDRHLEFVCVVQVFEFGKFVFSSNKHLLTPLQFYKIYISNL